MGEARPEPDPTRKLLKIFGVKVTDYEERTRALLERNQQALSAEVRQEIMREAAELSADLNHWLREMTNHVLALQSDFLRRLVAEQTRTEPHR